MMQEWLHDDWGLATIHSNGIDKNSSHFATFQLLKKKKTEIEVYHHWQNTAFSLSPFEKYYSWVSN